MNMMTVSGFSTDWPKKAACAPSVARTAVRKVWMVRVVGGEGSERLAGEASWKVAISVIIFGDSFCWGW